MPFRKKNCLLTVLFCLQFFGFAEAQRQVNTSSLTWTQYFFEGRFTEKVGLMADGGVRFNDSFGERFLLLLRSGVVWHFNNNFKAAGGYAYFKTLAPRYSGRRHIPENRLWQQVTYNIPIRKLNIQNRVRIEERWIDNQDTRFNFRARYSVNARQELFSNEKFQFYGVISHEIFFAFGEKTPSSHLDQHRTYVGAAWKVNKQATFTAGYLYIWQPQAAEGQFNQHHVLRATIEHVVDFRRPGKQAR